MEYRVPDLHCHTPTTAQNGGNFDRWPELSNQQIQGHVGSTLPAYRRPAYSRGHNALLLSNQNNVRNALPVYTQPNGHHFRLVNRHLDERNTLPVQRQTDEHIALSADTRVNGPNALTLQKQTSRHNALPVETHVNRHSALPLQRQTNGQNALPVETHVNRHKALPLQRQTNGQNALSVDTHAIGQNTLPIQRQNNSHNGLSVDMHINGTNALLMQRQNNGHNALSLQRQDNGHNALPLQAQNSAQTTSHILQQPCYGTSGGFTRQSCDNQGSNFVNINRQHQVHPAFHLSKDSPTNRIPALLNFLNKNNMTFDQLVKTLNSGTSSSGAGYNVSASAHKGSVNGFQTATTLGQAGTASTNVRPRTAVASRLRPGIQTHQPRAATGTRMIMTQMPPPSIQNVQKTTNVSIPHPHLLPGNNIRGLNKDFPSIHASNPMVNDGSNLNQIRRAVNNLTYNNQPSFPQEPRSHNHSSSTHKVPQTVNTTTYLNPSQGFRPQIQAYSNLSNTSLTAPRQPQSYTRPMSSARYVPTDLSIREKVNQVINDALSEKKSRQNVRPNGKGAQRDISNLGPISAKYPVIPSSLLNSDISKSQTLGISTGSTAQASRLNLNGIIPSSPRTGAPLDHNPHIVHMTRLPPVSDVSESRHVRATTSITTTSRTTPVTVESLSGSQNFRPVAQTLRGRTVTFDINGIRHNLDLPSTEPVSHVSKYRQCDTSRNEAPLEPESTSSPSRSPIGLCGDGDCVPGGDNTLQQETVVSVLKKPKQTSIESKLGCSDKEYCSRNMSSAGQEQKVTASYESGSLTYPQPYDVIRPGILSSSAQHTSVDPNLNISDEETCNGSTGSSGPGKKLTESNEYESLTDTQFIHVIRPDILPFSAQHPSVDPKLNSSGKESSSSSKSSSGQGQKVTESNESESLTDTPFIHVIRPEIVPFNAHQTLIDSKNHKESPSRSKSSSGQGQKVTESNESESLTDTPFIHVIRPEIVPFSAHQTLIDSKNHKESPSRSKSSSGQGQKVTESNESESLTDTQFVHVVRPEILPSSEQEDPSVDPKFNSSDKQSPSSSTSPSGQGQKVTESNESESLTDTQFIHVIRPEILPSSEQEDPSVDPKLNSSDKQSPSSSTSPSGQEQKVTERNESEIFTDTQFIHVIRPELVPSNAQNTSIDSKLDSSNKESPSSSKSSSGQGQKVTESNESESLTDTQFIHVIRPEILPSSAPEDPSVDPKLNSAGKESSYKSTSPSGQGQKVTESNESESLTDTQFIHVIRPEILPSSAPEDPSVDPKLNSAGKESSNYSTSPSGQGQKVTESNESESLLDTQFIHVIRPEILPSIAPQDPSVDPKLNSAGKESSNNSTNPSGQGQKVFEKNESESLTDTQFIHVIRPEILPSSAQEDPSVDHKLNSSGKESSNNSTSPLGQGPNFTEGNGSENSTDTQFIHIIRPELVPSNAHQTSIDSQLDSSDKESHSSSTNPSGQGQKVFEKNESESLTDTQFIHVIRPEMLPSSAQQTWVDPKLSSSDTESCSSCTSSSGQEQNITESNESEIISGNFNINEHLKIAVVDHSVPKETSGGCGESEDVMIDSDSVPNATPKFVVSKPGDHIMANQSFFKEANQTNGNPSRPVQKVAPFCFKEKENGCFSGGALKSKYKDTKVARDESQSKERSDCIIIDNRENFSTEGYSSSGYEGSFRNEDVNPKLTHIDYSSTGYFFKSSCGNTKGSSPKLRRASPDIRNFKRLQSESLDDGVTPIAKLTRRGVGLERHKSKRKMNDSEEEVRRQKFRRTMVESDGGSDEEQFRHVATLSRMRFDRRPLGFKRLSSESDDKYSTEMPKIRKVMVDRVRSNMNRNIFDHFLNNYRRTNESHSDGDHSADISKREVIRTPQDKESICIMSDMKTLKPLRVVLERVDTKEKVSVCLNENKNKIGSSENLLQHVVLDRVETKGKLGPSLNKKKQKIGSSENRPRHATIGQNKTLMDSHIKNSLIASSSKPCQPLGENITQLERSSTESRISTTLNVATEEPCTVETQSSYSRQPLKENPKPVQSSSSVSPIPDVIENSAEKSEVVSAATSEGHTAPNRNRPVEQKYNLVDSLVYGLREKKDQLRLLYKPAADDVILLDD